MRVLSFAFAMALVLGLALGLLLTGTGPGASGIVGGQYWILVIVAASVYLGWFVAQLSSATVGVLAAPILVLIMLAVLFGVKFVRVPWAPLVGDGFGILLAIYAASGTSGALLGRISRLRARTPSAAAQTGLWLATAVVMGSAATYALAAVIGT